MVQRGDIDIRSIDEGSVIRTLALRISLQCPRPSLTSSIGRTALERAATVGISHTCSSTPCIVEGAIHRSIEIVSLRR